MLKNLRFPKNKKFLLVLCILFIGLVLRLWNFQNLFYFAIDEEKGAYIIKGITTLSHFPALGHPSSVGFRLGPLLYYLIAPIYKIFGPNPLNWGFLSILTSLLSMTLIYKIGTKIDKLTGIFALFLYSLSYLNVLYDRRGWPVSFHSLIALAILYSLLKIKSGNQKYIFILTFTLIAATQFEIATLLFLPLVIVAWFLFRLKVMTPRPESRGLYKVESETPYRKPQEAIHPLHEMAGLSGTGVKRKLIIFSILLFLLSQSGFIISDLRHNFLNTKYLINYFNPAAKERIAKNVPLTGERSVYLAHNLIPSTFARTLFAFSPNNTAIQYANCSQYLKYKQSQIPIILKLSVVGVFLTFFYFMKRMWKEQNDKAFIFKIIFLYLTIIFFGISIYTYFFHGEMAEYYLLSTFAYFFIILGFWLSKLYKSKIGRLVVILLLLVFTIDNSQKLFLSQNPYGFKNKEKAINYSLSIVGNKSFVLDSFQTCWYSGGYRYLYTLADKEPLTSYMDQYLSEYYTPDKTANPEYLVVILTPELVGSNPSGYEIYKDSINSTADHKEKFGAIEVYIKKL